MGYPSKLGYFGKFGGRYVPETVMSALLELEKEYNIARKDKQFLDELDYLRQSYSGRPTPLYYAERLSKKWGGASIYLKREDLNHTGAHKINNCLGQGLLAKKMGKKRVIAETGAGQHGVAVATVACLFDLQCAVYMGGEDIERQASNVNRMKLLGAKVVSVNSGSRTLKDATTQAIREWVTNVNDSHYIIGSTVGPHPYPLLVRDFQSVIGKETKRQIRKITGRLPDIVIACVGGGSNALGMFYPFINNKEVELIGVESAGKGITTDYHAATLSKGKPGILHGSLSYLLQDSYGQIQNSYSISAGLDYPGVGPEHSHLKERGRVKYKAVNDNQALAAFFELTKTEGIIPALESSFALAYAKRITRKMTADKIIVVNLSGRGDKDLNNSAVINAINKINGNRKR